MAINRNWMAKITRTRTNQQPAALPFEIADLAFASWETIARRSWLMVAGGCSPIEYQQMMKEKIEAACDSALAVAFAPPHSMVSAALAPWTLRARANARRLRTAD